MRKRGKEKKQKNKKIKSPHKIIMKYLHPKTSKSFKKDFKLMVGRKKDPSKIQEAASFLIKNETLPERYKDHKLYGNYEGCRECYLEPDWLLIYRFTEDSVVFERTGAHSDLFKK